VSLIKEFNSLRQQIDRLFDDILHEQPQLGIFSKISEPLWSPAIELQETETELLLKAQLPGINPEELDIQISENAVFLSGEHKEQQKNDDQGIFRSEFHYGRFKRVIPLPIAIQREQAKAEMTAGLLTLTMLKATSALPNLVKVPVLNTEKSSVISTTEETSIKG
jgi:HSP20 family protein